MTVIVICEVYACCLELLDVEIMEETLSCNDCTIVDTHYLSLDDCRERELDDLVKVDMSLVEHLRDDGHWRVSSLTDT